MKNIQQFLKASLGLAFMAGSLMFTSCESDVIDLSPVNSLTDETAYATGDEIWRKECWKEGNYIEAFIIPNAVIYNGVVIKNRYGYEEDIASYN